MWWHQRPQLAYIQARRLWVKTQPSSVVKRLWLDVLHVWSSYAPNDKVCFGKQTLCIVVFCPSHVLHSRSLETSGCKLNDLSGHNGFKNLTEEQQQMNECLSDSPQSREINIRNKGFNVYWNCIKGYNKKCVFESLLYSCSTFFDEMEQFHNLRTIKITFASLLEQIKKLNRVHRAPRPQLYPESGHMSGSWLEPLQPPKLLSKTFILRAISLR